MGKKQKILKEQKFEEKSQQNTSTEKEEKLPTPSHSDKILKKHKKTHKRQKTDEAENVDVVKEASHQYEKVEEVKEEVKQTPETQEIVEVSKTEEAPLNIETLPGNENLSAFQLEDRKKRTIFVGNIPIDLPAKKLWYVFKNCGKVEKIWFRSIPPSTMITERRNVVKGKMIGNQKNNKNAYILFKEESSIEEALKLNNFLIQEEPPFHLRVDRDVKKEDDFESTLFVGNLPFIINEEDLRTHFGSLGKIKNIRIVRDPKTLIGVGISFIQFESKDETIKAVTECFKNKKYKFFKGRELRIKKATPPERRERKNKRKRDRKQEMKRHEDDNESKEFEQKFLKKYNDIKEKSIGTFQNDIKLKKFKKKKMLQQMISKGDSRIRNLSRSNITNKIDYHKLYQEKRDKKIDANFFCKYLLKENKIY